MPEPLEPGIPPKNTSEPQRPQSGDVRDPKKSRGLDKMADDIPSGTFRIPRV